MLGQGDAHGVGQSFASPQQFAAIVLVVFQAPCEHFVDPGSMQLGEARILVVACLAPFVMRLAQVLANALLDRR